jgi:signal transduction histidine kinase
LNYERKNIRLLLVDDETAFRDAISKRLIKREIESLQASSGEEALLMFKNNPIDIVVLDVKMPGINGIETLKKIKAKQNQKTEVILLTGHSSTEDGVSGIKEGAFDYLTKPVEFEHLLNKILQAYEKIIREKEELREKEFRKKIEQQMINTERLASLGTLAAGVAHEINNPLAIINDSAGWLRTILLKKEMEDIPGKENIDKVLEKIEISVQRAKKITHQLLSHSRKSDFIKKEVNVEELIDEVIQFFEREAVNNEIKLQKNIVSNLMNIFTDPNQLRQVLVNIVSNALHATEPNGNITINAEEEDNYIVVRVKDSGSGIPKEHIDKIFDPFFTTKAPGEGTGLGLTVCKSIMSNIGGQIEVESDFGKGTTFKLTIPMETNITFTENSGNDWKKMLENFKKSDKNG